MAGLTGKFCKIFFDDMGRVLVKEGTVIDESAVFIQIKTNGKIEAIPVCKVVRCEIL